MGEPSLFCVGGSQLKVMLWVLLVATGVDVTGGGVTAEVTLGTEVALPFVLPAVPVVPTAVVSATAVAVVELVLVLLAEVPAVLIPASPPQPASAIARLPIKDATTTRPATNPRSAFLIEPPKNDPSIAGQGRDEVTIGTLHERAKLWVQLSVNSRGGANHPGNPAVIGFVPLDR